MKKTNEYSYQKEKIKQLNDEYRHPMFSLERQLLRQIESGWLEPARKTLDLINKFERARLSKNELRSLKNSLIISASIFVRAAISANVNPKDAFTLSDYFIIEIEKINNIKDLEDFEYTMLEKTISLVIKESHPKYSKQVQAVITHINNNISKELNVKSLALLIKKSPDYLSNIFKKEVGRTVKDYINYNKIEVAKNYLDFSDIKIIDLAVLLSYCNQAYFSYVFKKYTGVSPRKYRSNHSASNIQE